MDANGRVTRYQYDLLGRMQEVIANDQPGLPESADVNVRTQFAYDPLGNLLSVTDPRNYVTQFAYTARNQLASVTDPLSRTMLYAYDPRGLLQRWTKADGTPIDYTYNARGLLTELSAPDQTVQYAYDAAGRRTTLDDATGSTSYAYDAASRPLTVTLSTGESVGYRYDDAGNRTRLIYPDGKTAVYTYTAANQLDHLADWDGGLTHYSYDENGRPAVVTFPNGVTTTLHYDAAGQVLTMTHALAGGPPTTFAYRYDPTGRRTHAIEDTRTISYTYDGLYRLAEARESSGDLYQYAYDAAGNRLSKIEPGEVVTATHDMANQLQALNGLPVSYDANGNLLDDGQHSYTYDDLDRLIQVTQGLTTTQFGYTGDGDRLWQATGGVTTTFTLDLNTALTQVLAQQGGGHTIRFLPGSGQQVDGAWQYLHADALGSVRLLSDANGQLLGSLRYSPFGEVEQQSGSRSPLGFTGQMQDAASGLTYLRALLRPSAGPFPDARRDCPQPGQWTGLECLCVCV